MVRTFNYRDLVATSGKAVITKDKNGIHHCEVHSVSSEIVLEDGSRLVRITVKSTIRGLELGTTNTKDAVIAKLIEELDKGTLQHMISMDRVEAQKLKVGELVEIWLRVFPS